LAINAAWAAASSAGGGSIDGPAFSGHQDLITESDLYLAIEDGKHLFEVVTVRREAAARRDEHVYERVLASGVATREQDRVRVPNDAEVWKTVIFVGSCDRELSLRIVGRY
jgi:hypothetical protein